LAAAVPSNRRQDMGWATAAEFSNINIESNSPATKKTKTDELSYEHNPNILWQYLPMVIRFANLIHLS